MIENRQTWVIILALLMMAGCLDWRYDLLPPRIKPLENSIVIEKPLVEVWNAAVPAIGKQFFVINNLDKSSGFINISYGGDPEAYVDCGRIISYVKNARGERTWDFSAAKADQVYEVLDHSGFYTIRRRMSLDGRMNLVFEEMGPTRTRVTANTRYIITRSIQVEGFRRDDSSISFNSGSVGYFPVIGPEPDATKCVATGKLERDVLSLINGGELHPHSRSPENWSDLE